MLTLAREILAMKKVILLKKSAQKLLNFMFFIRNEIESLKAQTVNIKNRVLIAK